MEAPMGLFNFFSVNKGKKPPLDLGMERNDSQNKWNEAQKKWDEAQKERDEAPKKLNEPQNEQNKLGQALNAPDQGLNSPGQDLKVLGQGQMKPGQEGIEVGSNESRFNGGLAKGSREPGRELVAPFNPVTGELYHSFNRLRLSRENFSDPRFVTYLQAEGMGLRVKDGVQGIPLEYWQWTETVKIMDARGRPVKDENGADQVAKISLVKPKLRTFLVFNLQQLETSSGQPVPSYSPPRPSWDPEEAFNELVAASQAKFSRARGDDMMYDLRVDTIFMPSREAFETPGSYYRVAIHELVHWTRHPERLNRATGHKPEKRYSREEILAEMATFMIAQDLRLELSESEFDWNYMRHNLDKFQPKPREFAEICAHAEKARDYLIGLVPGLEDRIRQSLGPRLMTRKRAQQELKERVETAVMSKYPFGNLVFEDYKIAFKESYSGAYPENSSDLADEAASRPVLDGEVSIKPGEALGGMVGKASKEVSWAEFCADGSMMAAVSGYGERFQGVMDNRGAEPGKDKGWEPAPDKDSEPAERPWSKMSEAAYYQPEDFAFERPVEITLADVEKAFADQGLELRLEAEIDPELVRLFAPGERDLEALGLFAARRPRGGQGFNMADDDAEDGCRRRPGSFHDSEEVPEKSRFHGDDGPDDEKPFWLDDDDFESGNHYRTSPAGGSKRKPRQAGLEGSGGRRRAILPGLYPNDPALAGQNAAIAAEPTQSAPSQGVAAKAAAVETAQNEAPQPPTAPNQAAQAIAAKTAEKEGPQALTAPGPIAQAPAANSQAIQAPTAQSEAAQVEAIQGEAPKGKLVSNHALEALADQPAQSKASLALKAQWPITQVFVFEGSSAHKFATKQAAIQEMKAQMARSEARYAQMKRDEAAQAMASRDGAPKAPEASNHAAQAMEAKAAQSGTPQALTGKGPIAQVPPANIQAVQALNAQSEAIEGPETRNQAQKAPAANIQAIQALDAQSEAAQAPAAEIQAIQALNAQSETLQGPKTQNQPPKESAAQGPAAQNEAEKAKTPQAPTPQSQAPQNVERPAPAAKSPAPQKTGPSAPNSQPPAQRGSEAQNHYRQTAVSPSSPLIRMRAASVEVPNGELQELMGQEALGKIRQDLVNEMVATLGSVGLAGAREERWKNLVERCEILSTQKISYDLGFLAFLDECRRVGTFVGKRIASWGKNPPGERIKEATLYTGFLLIVKAARELGYDDFPFPPDNGQGGYEVAALTVGGGFEKPCPIRINGAPIQRAGLAKEGDPVHGHAIYRVSDKEAVMLLKDGDFANGICQALNSPDTHFQDNDILESQSLRKWAVKPIKPRKRAHEPYTDEESEKACLEIRRRNAARDRGEKVDEPLSSVIRPAQ